jgi:hypothetical protein
MSGDRSSSNNPDNLSLPVAIHAKSHQLPFNSCLNVRVLHNLILITLSAAAILNLPINSFCPVNTVLVLTSDNFHLNFPPSPPPFLLCNSLVALFKNSHVVPSLPRVHIHLVSFDRERHL